MPIRMILCGAVLCRCLPSALTATAQDAAAAKPVTFLGTVQSLSGNSISVKNDAGATMQVTVEDNARLLRVEPGQKTLAGASPFSLADLQTGDRVMARGSSNADGKSLDATLLVAIKGADIAQKQEKEREDWQKRGTGGLVKSVDAAAGTVTVSSGLVAPARQLSTLHPLRLFAAMLRARSNSIRPSPAPWPEIKPGDQLRARGSRSARRRRRSRQRKLSVEASLILPGPSRR